MKRKSESGFTLVELATVVLIMGIILTFAIPAYRRYSQSYLLRATSENLSSYIKLAREREISSRDPNLLLHLNPNYPSLNGPTDVHIHVGSGVRGMKFPRGVSYYSYTTSTWYWQPNGRVTSDPGGTSPISGTIVLQNARGLRDTVSIQSSGMVTVY